MQKITFINSKEQSITLKDTFPYLVQNLSGIGVPAAQPLTQRGFQQNGVSYFGNLLNPRVITFMAVISAPQRNALLSMRENIFKVFNPSLGLGTLRYENGLKTYEIQASVVEGPAEIPQRELRGATMQSFEVTLYCPLPAWEIPREDVEMVGFEGGVELGELTDELDNPFELGEGEAGLMLATQGDYAEIGYYGTLDAPLVIEFQGPAVRPKITKLSTGEYIEVSVGLLEGETLFIKTRPDAIDVYKTDSFGHTSSAFNYIDPYSTYFLLTPGTNELAFSVESGDPKVFIGYAEKYVGV